MANGDAAQSGQAQAQAQAQAQRQAAERAAKSEESTSSDLVRQEHQLMADVRDAHEADQVALNEQIAENRARARQEYSDSEQGAVKEQIAESERIMRMRTPEALDALGAVQGDPTKGPSA